MKSILAFMGLAAFLTISVMVHLNLKATRTEQTVIGWSNSLIWSALRTPTAPSYTNPKLDKAESNGRWRVAGNLEYRDPDGTLVRRTYRAMIAQSCPLRERTECWELASLEVGGKAVDLHPPDRETVETAGQEAGEAAPASSGPSGPSGLKGGDASREATATRDVVADLPDRAATAQPPVLERSRATDANPVVTETPVAVEIIDQRTLVLRIQKRLDALGFDPGVPDGQFGPRTESAIRAYQASRGLADEGTPSIQLLQQLESR